MNYVNASGEPLNIKNLKGKHKPISAPKAQLMQRVYSREEAVAADQCADLMKKAGWRHVRVEEILKG